MNPVEVETHAPRGAEPGNPPGAPLFIVFNSGAGHGDSAETVDTIGRVLSEAGRRHEILRVDAPEQLTEVARQAVAKAQGCGGVVIASGGDGTLNTVAQATLGSGCAFGVIPQGTFNYFGRSHGISSVTEDATRALLDARVHAVQVGLVNDRVFLVNAGLGLYPRSLQDREAQKRRFGRSRLVAAWAALVTLWRPFRPTRIVLEHAGERREVRALTLFVGNNRLQLEQVGLPEAAAVEADKLVVILVRAMPTRSLLWLLARGAMGSLGEAPGIEHFALSDLRVTTARPRRRPRRMKIATDGEINRMEPPIRFRVAPEPLLLLKPADAPT